MVEKGTIGSILVGEQRRADRDRAPAFTIEVAQSGSRAGRGYLAIRHAVFVEEHGLFDRHDLDDADDDPRTVVLVARDAHGAVLGGVRIGPVGAAGDRDIGWWAGSRLAVAAHARRLASSGGGVGPALVRAACAHAEAAGVLRFDATVRAEAAGLFSRLGWVRLDDVTVQGAAHVRFRWPIQRIATLAATTKAALGGLLAGLHPQGTLPGGAGFVGDDGAPVPGSDLIAACDAIVPSMIERDPEWAGWCAVLVNVNDLAAMGAHPVGLLDALGARDASFATRILSGLRRASVAYGVPVLGGHTQLGVGASLSVTALGRTTDPVPAGGGRPGDAVRVTADLGGGWRSGYAGRQWDSSTGRTPAELATLTSFVRRTRPAAAKDVSMAGVVGTLGMLAEAGGCAAVIDVADVPRPDAATAGDWLTCFPGFGMITAERAGTPEAASVAAAGPATTRRCGELEAGRGVYLRWPDGVRTEAVAGPVTGMGIA